MEALMSEKMWNILAALLSTLVFAIVLALVIESQLIFRVWNYWQVHAVIPSYKGRWELGALIVSFAIPVLGLLIPGVAALGTFGLMFKLGTKNS